MQKEITQLTNCAQQHIKNIRLLSEKKLNRKYPLECTHGNATLQELLSEYTCPKCNESFFYSFCTDDVFNVEIMWHCNECKTCSDRSEWHCDNCNECTFGVTLPCEWCGKKSPNLPDDWGYESAW